MLAVFLELACFSFPVLVELNLADLCVCAVVTDGRWVKLLPPDLLVSSLDILLKSSIYSCEVLRSLKSLYNLNFRFWIRR